MSEIVIIAAVARNRVIGKDNRLLWNIPEDMAHFKALTTGHTVVMGRKTWESLPPRFRPLPGRRNIVISRQTDYPAPGAELADSLENALKLASTAATVFVIGGEQIYSQALAVADRLEESPDLFAFFLSGGRAESRFLYVCIIERPMCRAATGTP